MVGGGKTPLDLPVLIAELEEAAAAGDAARVAELDQKLRSEAMAMIGTTPVQGQGAKESQRAIRQMIEALRSISSDVAQEKAALKRRRANQHKVRLVYSGKGRRQ